MSNTNNFDLKSKQMGYVIRNFCSTCGTKITNDSSYCVHCGTVVSVDDLDVETYQAKQKETTNKKIVLGLVSSTAIWISVFIASLFAPNLISGSQQQQLPLVAWTAWLWGLLATMFAIRICHEAGSMDVINYQTMAVVVLWIAVAFVSVFAPVLVTGSDPTYLPLTSLVAPFIGFVLTSGIWFLGKPTYY